MADNTSSNRGFAAMSREKQREIAAMGGRASHGARKKSTNKKPGPTARSGTTSGASTD